MPKQLKTWKEIRDASAYNRAALHLAEYVLQMHEGLPVSWEASIPGFDGLWVRAPTVEEAERQLRTALIRWKNIHVEQGGDVLPTLPPCPLCREKETP